MKLYEFEAREELLTPIQVMAESEQEARERVFCPDETVTSFDTIRGYLRLVLRAVIDD